MFSFSHRTHAVLLVLTILASAFILWPCHNFQDFLAQGDHGRDLYAAEAVLRGEIPYRDFWWVYGPVMPYYYGACLLVFGHSITAILLGKLLLNVLAAVLIYLIMALCASPMAAVLTALWFTVFHQEFFFTYNHIGGIVCILGILYMAMSYLKRSDMRFLWAGLGIVFLLGLIKLNFGISCLLALTGSVFIIDRSLSIPWASSKKIFYILAFAFVPFMLFMSYAHFLHTLSMMEIRQCLPYWGDDQPYNTSPLLALINFVTVVFNNIRANPYNLTFALLVIGAIARLFYLVVKRQFTPQERKTFLLTVAVLGIFYTLNFHEYLKSGVWYRSFWVQPISMMLSFYLIDRATARLHLVLRIVLLGAVAFILLRSVHDFSTYVGANKNPAQALTTAKGTVYLRNNPSWIQTVEQTTAYLNQTLKKDELFFALPYDCLYYYLTDKKSPTRQLIFFDHIKIPPEQDRAVITELEKNKVNYVLISSRSGNSREYGLGTFGKTYSPLLGRYIEEHFERVAQFGDWTNEPGWAWNHGTMILKRKDLL